MSRTACVRVSRLVLRLLLSFFGRSHQNPSHFFRNRNMLQLSFLLLLPLVLLIDSRESDTTVFTNESGFPWKLRLPETVKPVHYDLLIHPNLTLGNITGRVQIRLDVQRDTGHLLLHSRNLQISDAVVSPSGDARPLHVYQSEPFEQIALFSRDFVFTKGVHVIRLDFSANLSASFHGFYKSSYTTPSGEIRALASTHFEPTHARAAFPCFDEPAFKANFSIRVRREPRHISISNMPKFQTVALTADLLEDQFYMSVKMSTYLVAFIVCDFASIRKRSQHGVQISVYTVPEKINQAEYALNTAVTLLDFYDNYFGIPYPLPKQDLAAIPDFQSGAMENWGLTTYRESRLLFDPERSSTSDKLGIIKVIAHELAHQWFGNLVTMQWWNDLWLNEGFAKFMEFVSTNITYPELQVNDYFLEKCFTAMAVDSLSSSHPISTPVENPTEIREMFDDVSYQKGACVLNMLRDFLNPEVFKLGVISYLKKHSYQNTVTADLWDSLTNICDSDDFDVGRLNTAGFCTDSRKSRPSVSKWYLEDDLNVKAIMDTWTLQEGFPVITVEVRGREVKLKQERFLKGVDTSNDASFIWQVPLTYITSSSSSVQRFLLKNRKDVLYLPTEVEWIKFNVQMRGYYIVHYEAQGWDVLIKQLQHNHTVFSGNDRASLVHDIFQLVKIKKVSLDKALSLSLYLRRETEIAPVTQGFSELVPLYKLMEKRNMTALEHQLKAFLVSLFQGLIDTQTWNDEGSVSERILRTHLLLFACVHRYAPCVNTAQDIFLKWKESGGNMRLPADVRLVVYTEGARTEEGWDFLMEIYRYTVYPSEKRQIKAALSYSPLAQKLEWLMDQGLEGGVVKTHDLPSLVISVSKNPKAYKLAWNFLRTNWPELVKKFDVGSSSISRLVVELTNQFSTKEMLEEVGAFFGALPVNMGAGLRSIQQALENIQENIRWMDRNIPLLTDWLNKVKQSE